MNSKFLKSPLRLALCLSLTAVTASAADIREGLVSYWPLDTISSDFTSTPDVVSANHMLLANIADSSVLMEGKRGKAFLFDGDTSQRYLFHTVAEGTDNGLPVSRSRRYSILLWVKGKGSGQSDRRIFSESSSTVNDPLVNIGTHNAGTDDTVDIFVRNSGTQINHYHSRKAGLDDAWHHIAWTFDNGLAKLYLDAEPDYTNTFSPGPTPYDTTSIGAILRASPSHYFAGAIDDVAVWERALSAEEIREIMNNGIQTPVPKFAPAFLGQPQGANTLIIGDNYILTAQAIGTRPLSYEWRKNNATIAGATTPALSLSALKAADSGDYTVVVRNTVGSVTSQVATLLVSPPPPPNLTNGLVAYWPLNEVQGTRTPDVAGGYDMELVNLTAADLVAGKWGQAFKFENARQTMLERLHLPADPLPIYKHPSFTVSLWVNGPPNQQDLRVFSEASTTSNNPLINIGTHNTAANGAVDIYIRNDSGQQGGHRFSVVEAYDNTWHHVVYAQRESGGTMEGALYIDGIKDEVALDPRRPMTVNTTSIGGIRRAARTFWFNGMIDDVALWKRALTAEEVAKLFKEGMPALTVQVVQPLVIRSFRADLPAVAKGDSVALRWDVSKDSTQIVIDQGVGDVAGKTLAGAGGTLVSLTESKTFTLTIRRGNETLTATTTVAAIDGVAPGWTLLENFDRYAPGPLVNGGYWLDLQGGVAVANVNGNRLVDLRGNNRAAILPLRDLTVKEGQQRTLFGRIYVQGDATAANLSIAGLTEVNLRTYGDINDSGGFGPALYPSVSNGELMVGAKNGVGGTVDYLPPVLQPQHVYNFWIDIKNDPIATGDIFSIYLQKEGDAQRTALFSNYVSNRDPAGGSAASGLGATLPDLDKLFVGNNAVNSVFFDDFYLSKSGFNPSVPRPFGFTTPISGQALTVSISRAGNDLELRWTEGILESATSLLGPWSAVAGAAAPAYKTAPEGTQKYFRIRK
ncbi:MAG: hypothetical protein HYY23_00135 [Verrucomicrobia bacterium]|nr:hypothetical protein [Verrucomicrobiota bacterium]